ncbi:acyltransferase [Paraburkholderia xenovorans]|uniref:acyltransferase family protein n=1 Tax=Paraburkholderia xenovorans TaxID=36873 RepID=UPI0038BD50A1
MRDGISRRPGTNPTPFALAIPAKLPEPSAIAGRSAAEPTVPLFADDRFTSYLKLGAVLMATGLNQSGGGFPALTSIRFIAAFAVVISHYSENGLLRLPSSIFNFIDGGRTAVSLFFVLSGFILTFTYRDKIARDGARPFYEARIARIYPMILLGLLLCVPVVVYLLYTGNAALMLKWFALKSSVYLSLVASLICQLLLINGWFPFSAINQPWNGPSDSISCEIFFYLLFPFLLRRMMRMKATRLVLVCATLWIATGIWIVFLNTYLPISRSGSMIYSLPITRLSEFMMGIASAITFLRLSATGVSYHTRGKWLVGVALVGVVILSLWRPVSPDFYLQGPFFAVLILGLSLLERPVIFGFLSSRPMVRLGEASYSLYLTHLPIALIALMLGFGESTGWIVIIFSVLASLVFFKFYEEPMRRHIKARFAEMDKRKARGESGQPAVSLPNQGASITPN